MDGHQNDVVSGIKELKCFKRFSDILGLKKTFLPSDKNPEMSQSSKL